MTYAESRYLRVEVSEEHPEERVQDFREVLRPYTRVEATLEAQRCLQCALPYCVEACPITQDCRGYISLIATDQFDPAARLILRENPLASTLCKVCYRYCEDACIMNGRGVPIAIRHLKQAALEFGESDFEYVPSAPLKERVGIIGAGPAGLMAAWRLRLRGYKVTVFEANTEPGGILRWGIPSYRLPKEVLQRDLDGITAAGIQIETGHPVTSVRALIESGFDAVFLATGGRGGRKLLVPGEELSGVYDSIDFLHQVNEVYPPGIAGRNVLVIGGGNVAIDSARSALRLGARSVQVFCLESRAEMPARARETQAAEDEGVVIATSWGVARILGDHGRVSGAELVRCTSVFDPEHHFRPVFDPTVRQTVPAHAIITAIGLEPNTASFASELALRRNGTIQVDPKTLATSILGVFAGGDAVTGPSVTVDPLAGKPDPGEPAHRFDTRSMPRVLPEGTNPDYLVNLERVIATAGASVVRAMAAAIRAADSIDVYLCQKAGRPVVPRPDPFGTGPPPPPFPEGYSEPLWGP
ncbi:MAG: FAD-dependent oxidoreductase [Thermoplasmata archaeon]|jgi:NADPH-dependent glutamate synthase beta subunit-like oxidoreductase